jgi:hypothetical protein
MIALLDVASRRLISPAMTDDRLVDLITVVRTQIGARPFWCFVALLLAIQAGRHWRSGRAGARPEAQPGTSPGADASAVGGARWPQRLALATIGLYAAIVAWYAVQPLYVDYAEPTIAAVAWIVNTGGEMYHGVSSADRYSHMYGPVAFLLPAWVMALLGPTIQTSKLAGILAAAIGLPAMFVLARRVTSVRTALVCTGLFCGLCLTFRHLSFWIRPDSFLLLFATASLLAAMATRRAVAIVGFGVCVGLLVNLKLTGPLYALPALGLLIGRAGLASAVAAGAIAALVAVAPFALVDHVSWTNYAHWVRLSAHNGLEFWLLRQNVEQAVFLLIPLAPCLCAGTPTGVDRRASIGLLAGLAAGMCGVAIAASKPGAGPYHLLPFVSTVVFVVALYADGVRRAGLPRQSVYVGGVAAFLVSVAVAAFGQQGYLFTILARGAGRHEIADILAYAAAHPSDTIAIGYTDHDAGLTLARPVLVFAGQPYLIDMPAVQEYQMSGVPLPEATIAAIRGCRVRVWLMAKDGTPFMTLNNYARTGYGLLFDDRIRAAFAASYVEAGETRYYKAWRCRATP